MRFAQIIAALLFVPLVNSRAMYGEDKSGLFAGVTGPPSQPVDTDWFREYVEAREEPVEDPGEEDSNKHGKSDK